MPIAKFLQTRQELTDSLIERESEIDLVMTALICQEHVLFVGPPGTAKSMLADAIVSWLHGDKFSVQLTKFSTPEDVFGPISVAGLKNDEYRRITRGKMPEAHVAYVDEIFNASSAILNTLLQVLNERTYRNNGSLMQCPLLICIGASNSWPGDQEGGKELGALFDRFLFRKPVKSISHAKSIDRLLWGPDPTPKLSTQISGEEIHQATSSAQALPWSIPAKDAFQEIRHVAKKEGIQPGDRRLRKSVLAAQAFAWLNGAAEVEPDHLEILGHVLWDDPAEQPAKLQQIVGKIANPVAMQVNSRLMEAEQIIAACDPRNLQAAFEACKKLGEIHRKLTAIAGPKAATAADYVKTKAADIKKATVEEINM